MQYTVAAVSPEVRSFGTRYGDMKSYKVRFQETGEQVVEIAQKASSQAPAVGQTLEGSIDTSGQYGPKFKKEYSGGDFQGSSRQSSGRTSNYGASHGDQFTMYLSYAKDVAVALIAKDGNLDKLSEYMQEVADAGEFLYNAHNSPQTDNEDKGKPTDVTPSEDDVIQIMGGGTQPDLSQIPF